MAPNREQRDKYYRRKYGFGLLDYETMLESQLGSCAICNRKPRKYILAVDHDHHTGKIRGLLCRRCNQTLGRIGDTLAWAQKFVRYLENAER